MKYLIAVAAMLAAVPALADGLPDLPSVTKSKSVHCYLGLGVSGSFVRDNTTTVATSFPQGDALIGAIPEIGCDLQRGPLVIGVGGDYTFQSSKSASSFLGVTDSIPMGNEWSAWGRVGVFTNNKSDTLLYLKGGVAGVDGRTVTVMGLPASFAADVGPFAGAGIESAIGGGLKVFVEYRHEWLGAGSTMVDGVLPMRLNTDDDRVIAGLRFNLN